MHENFSTIFDPVVSQIILTAIIFLSGVFWAKLHRVASQYKAIREGLISLLRTEIINVHEESTFTHEISYIRKEAIEKMFRAYSDLGGNGVIKHLMKEINELPIVYERHKHDGNI